MIRTLQAGVGSAKITPPVGIALAGVGIREGPSDGIGSDLHATALILADGNCKVVIMSCDLLYLRSPFVDRLREHIGDTVGTPAGNVLISCSHTHSGPSIGDTHVGPRRQDGQNNQQTIGDAYRIHLQSLLAGAAYRADRNLQDVRVGAAKGHVQIGINRREKLTDGSIVIGANPEGPVDPEVGIIRIDDLQGKPVAILLNYACHPTVFGPAYLSITSEFPGRARQVAESLTGATCVFLQGAAGDIDPVCGHVKGPEAIQEVERLGTMLGCEAVKAFSSIRTHYRSSTRTIVQSLARFNEVSYQQLKGPTAGHLHVATRRLTLPLLPLPDKRTAEAMMAQRLAILEELKSRPASKGQINVAQHAFDWAVLQLEAIRSVNPEVHVEMEIQVIRINDIILVAIPAEPFAQIGLRIKQHSPFANTLVLGYANGCIAYIPTAEAFADGGYEVESHMAYKLPSGVTPDWADRVVETSLELVNTLALKGGQVE